MAFCVKVDYIRQLAAEEHEGLSSMTMIGVARTLSPGARGEPTESARAAGLAFALERSRGECAALKRRNVLPRVHLTSSLGLIWLAHSGRPDT